ncbi:MAG: DUF3179 domain-containing protein [Chloroflexota bacterium]
MIKLHIYFLLNVTSIFFASCGSIQSSGDINEQYIEPKLNLTQSDGFDNQGEIPPVDVSKHSVPLNEIIFDTFRAVNRGVPLSFASPELIQDLVDAIPPIHKPNYQSPEEASWLNDSDVVIGYSTDSGAWAFPLRILNYHEIVNDVIEGIPVLISYCPLCYSGVVYHRQVENQILTFGNTSALYESDMVMLDYQTGSYWWQVAGKSIVGKLNGKSLQTLPSQSISWGEWQKLHPDTLVLSTDTGYTRNYGIDPFGGYQDRVNAGQFAFPVSEDALNMRLKPGALVIAAIVREDVHVYVLETKAAQVIMDTIAGKNVVVFISGDGTNAGIFEATLEDEKLTFEIRENSFIDLKSGSAWSLGGEAISGSLQGKRLMSIATKTSFWFAMIAAEPNAVLVLE